MEKEKWLRDLRPNILKFLESMYLGQGKFRYSYEGDVFNEGLLPSSVYALKTLYLLQDDFGVVEDIILNIKSYQKPNGYFYDPIIFKRSYLRNIASQIKHLRFHSFNNQMYVRAETRQCLSSLSMYSNLLSVPEDCIAKSPELYLKRLDWRRPWGGGSHLSHYMFFMKASSASKELINQTYNCLRSLEQEESGGWYWGKVDDRQIINGAMKVLTGMHQFDRFEVLYPERLIDTCLRNINNQNACDSFNVIYVLKRLSEIVDHTYRYDEIVNYAHDRLSLYFNHYKEGSGGFSFNKDFSNTYLYGAAVSQGLPVADIHGTVMLMWGMSLIDSLLDLGLNLREFKP